MSNSQAISTVNIRAILKNEKCDNVAKEDVLSDDRHGHMICNPGEIINYKYRIVEKLGKGTFGIVMKVIDIKTNKALALKVSRNKWSCWRAAKMELMALEYIAGQDPNNISLCAKLISSFEYNGHVCMAFEELGSDIFHFMKKNSFAPMPLNQVRHIVLQLCYSVNFLHQRGIIHTDLKPDNILFVDSSYTMEYDAERRMDIRLVDRTDIRLIDFGCAVGNELPQSGTISNRYYRAPEVVLNKQWSETVDVWSIGCILYELYTGDVLFHTEDNDLEHLGIMERVLGSVPRSMTADHKYFPNGKLNFDWSTRPLEVDSHQPLHQCLKSDGEDDFYLYNLMKNFLAYEPSARITLKDALMHPFFDKLPSDQRLH